MDETNLTVRQKHHKMKRRQRIENLKRDGRAPLVPQLSRTKKEMINPSIAIPTGMTFNGPITDH